MFLDLEITYAVSISCTYPDNTYNDAYFDEVKFGHLDRILPLLCLIKEIYFCFISIICPIWIATYHLKCFMVQSVLKFKVLLLQLQN